MTASGGEATSRLEAIVSGRVQGVGFRWFAVSEATRLGCTGWVGNEPDGTVRVVAEGPRRRLEILLASLREGPAGARVDDARARWLPPTGEFPAFGLRSRSHPGD